MSTIGKENLRPGKDNHGGKRKGAGRPPNWFREKCAKALEKYKLVGFVSRVAAGLETEQKTTKDGDVVTVAASIHDRLYAFEMLANWGVGKPHQSMEVSGSMNLSGFVSALREEGKKRGLKDD